MLDSCTVETTKDFQFVKKNLYANFVDVRREVVDDIGPVITGRDRKLSLKAKTFSSVGNIVLRDATNLE